MRINNCSEPLRHELDQIVNHLHWDGHPLLLKCLKQLAAHLQGRSLCLMPAMKQRGEKKSVSIFEQYRKCHEVSQLA